MLRSPLLKLCIPLAVIPLMMVGATLHADPIPVRQTQGTMHGFLEVRNESGEIIGHGDLLQTVHGTHATTELSLHFNNGSIDDETATFTQERTLRLVSDHHVQKGPFFPHPLDTTIEANGNITNRSLDKDGKEQVETTHLDLPADISNGMIGPLLLSVPPTAPEFTLGMVLPVGKGRLAKLHIAPEGEQPFTITGVTHKATLFRIKIDLGGIIGAIAPIVGKAPEDVHVWVLEGAAPELIRVDEQLYAGGPVVSIELAGTTYPHKQ